MTKSHNALFYQNLVFPLGVFIPSIYIFLKIIFFNIILFFIHIVNENCRRKNMKLICKYLVVVQLNFDRINEKKQVWGKSIQPIENIFARLALLFSCFADVNPSIDQACQSNVILRTCSDSYLVNNHPGVDRL